MTFPPSDDLLAEAATLLSAMAEQHLKLATAESCTGGLIAATLTEVPGSSSVVDRGFITYSNEAKTELLGVDPDVIASNGAVSEPVARAMAAGALDRSMADITVAVTGVAGPGGGTDDKPVGLVHLAAARRDKNSIHSRCEFGDVGRSEVRRLAIAEAFRLVRSLM